MMKTVLSAMVLAAGTAYAAQPEFVLPDTIYAAPGIECNVYFASVLNSARPEVYAFEVRPGGKDSHGAGRCENERWTWTPKEADAGSSEQIVFNAWSDDGLVCCRTVTVVVASAKPDPARRLTYAILGDSLTNARYQDQILADVRKAGWSACEAVGSHCGGSASTIGEMKEGEAPHDGYGGYMPGSFLSSYRITPEELEAVQDEQERKQLARFVAKGPMKPEWRKNLLKSPIVRIKDGEKVVDVQAWFDRVNGGKAPDFIFIYLGPNGACAQRDETIEAHCRDSQVAPMRKLVSYLRAAAPDAKIGIGTCGTGSTQDAFGNGYGCAISSVQYRKNIHYLNKCWMALVREFNDAGDKNVFIVPVGQAISPVYGHLALKVKPFVHASETIERRSNALHPAEVGGKQLGDAFAAWLLCNVE